MGGLYASVYVWGGGGGGECLFLASACVHERGKVVQASVSSVIHLVHYCHRKYKDSNFPLVMKVMNHSFWTMFGKFTDADLANL